MTPLLLTAAAPTAGSDFSPGVAVAVLAVTAGLTVLGSLLREAWVRWHCRMRHHRQFLP